MVAMTITLILMGLAFGMLAATLRQKTRLTTETASLSDASQSLSWMITDIRNAGFGLDSNGIVAADSNEDQIRIRANLNALAGETTSNAVTDQGEDVIYSLATKPGGGAALVRTDVNTGQQSVVATTVDNTDLDNDGDPDGLTIQYLDMSGTAVSPDQATQVIVSLRITLPQIGVPGADGYQPSRTKVVREPVVIRNTQLAAY